MSGVFGYMYNGYKPRDSNRDLKLMHDWHKHYGQDCDDTMIMDNVGMGYCVNHFSKKFPSPDNVSSNNKTFAVMDALLFNRDELFDKLYYPSSKIIEEKKTTVSDEQLLHEIFNQFGSDGLAFVNGDFAGAVYNEEDEEITLFSNHLGVRPLFYYYDGELFAFATDYRAILALPGVDTTLDEELLYRIVRGMNTLENERTVFKYIKALKPAHILKFDGVNPPKLKVYWKLGAKKIRFADDKDYVEKMRELIEDSIKRRLSAYDGAVGGELSGGLDSSVIDILINQTGRKGFYHTWSPSFEQYPRLELDERVIIEAICKQEKINCQYSDLKVNLDYKNKYFPNDANTTNISTSMRYFRNCGTKIAFSGWGGDEGVSIEPACLSFGTIKSINHFSVRFY